MKEHTQHGLRFEALSWQDFERMSLWLIRREGYTDTELVGSMGGDRGADIIARLEGEERSTLFQCKNVRTFGPAQAKSAVDKIVENNHGCLPAELVFIVGTDVSRKTRDAARESAAKRFRCSFWAGGELDERIRRFPEIVQRFFGSTDPVARLGFRSMAMRAEQFVMRREYEEIMGELRDAASSPHTSSGIGITTALRGAGGFGKTVLAQAVCSDETLPSLFPDGVLWTTLGQWPSEDAVRSKLRDMLRWWLGAEPPAYETLQATAAALREALRGSRVLVVVDDVWSRSDLAPFLSLSEDAVLLVTTRVGSVLPAGAVAFRVDAMRNSEACELLRLGLGDSAEGDVSGLASRLGEWPLLLALVNRQLVQATEGGLTLERSILQVAEDFGDVGVTAFDCTDERSRSDAVRRTVDASLRCLSPQLRAAFFELAVFPEDADIPVATVMCLWGLTANDARRFCQRLDELSLLASFNRPRETIRLHDVVREFVIEEQGDRIPALHRKLVLSYSKPVAGEFSRGLDDGYYFQMLPYHLRAAGMSKELRSLLFDYRWLESKLRATDVQALIMDFELLNQDLGAQQMVEMLDLAAPIIQRHSQQLATQLLGRRGKGLAPDVEGLVAQLESARPCRLTPRSPTLMSASSPVLRGLGGHGTAVSGLVQLGQNRLISGSWDGSLRVWDLESGKCTEKFDVESSVVAMDLQGQHDVALAGSDGIVRIFNTQRRGMMSRLTGHKGGARAVSWLDSNTLVSAGEDDTIRVWRLDRNECLREWPVPDQLISELVPLEHDRFLSCEPGGGVMLWSIDSDESRVVLAPQIGGRHIATLDSDRLISMEPMGAIQEVDIVTTEARHLGTVNANHIIAVSEPKEGRVAIVCDYRSVQVVELASGSTIANVSAPTGRITSVTWVTQVVVACGTEEGTLWLVDTSQSDQEDMLVRHTGRVTTILRLTSTLVASSSWDGQVLVWDPRGGRARRFIRPRLSMISEMKLVGSTFLATASFDKSISLWSVTEGTNVSSVCHNGLVTGMTYLGDHSVVSSSRHDDCVRVWCPFTGNALPGFEGHTEGVEAIVRITPELLVSGDRGGNVRVWDVASRRLLRTLVGHEREVHRIIKLDDFRVVSASHDYTLRVWDIRSGELLHVLIEHSYVIFDVLVVGDDRIVSVGADTKVVVWDTVKGVALASLVGHEGGVSCVTVLDESHVATGSDHGELRIWDWKAGHLDASLNIDAGVSSLLWIPSERVLVVGDDSGGMHFMDYW